VQLSSVPLWPLRTCNAIIRAVRAAVGLAAIGLAAVGPVAGCGSERDRPPPVSLACPKDDPSCSALAASGSGAPTQQPDVGLAGAAGAEAGAILTGTVLELTRDDFAEPTALGEVVQVFAQGPGGVTVATEFDGEGDFRLEGIAPDSPVWVGVSPSSSSTDLLTTLQPVDVVSEAGAELVVAHVSTVELIFGLLTEPAARDPGQAQVLLRFVDAGHAGVAGVSVLTDPMAERVIYRAAGTWSEEVSVTDGEGLVMLANLVAYELPGGQVPVSVETVAGTSVIWPRVAQGALTLMTVLVAP
jgi:hypothetical protein